MFSIHAGRQVWVARKFSKVAEINCITNLSGLPILSYLR